MKDEMIVVTVEGGIVQSIYSRNNEVECLVVDIDKHADEEILSSIWTSIKDSDVVNECLQEHEERNKDADDKEI